jgi:threonine dehydrogenase-like Zn-dependent dehydrogenase
MDKILNHSSDNLDALIFTEPLACVLHAHKKIPESFNPSSVTIFGFGPIGAMHLILLKERFPSIKVHICEPDNDRIYLATKIFSSATVSPTVETAPESDLTITASSHPNASIGAATLVKSGGIALLFCGIDHKKSIDLPVVGGLNLETVHRNEEVRTLPNTARLIGSSGYSRVDIDDAAKILLNNPERWLQIRTGLVNGLLGTTIDQNDIGVPAITELLINESVHRKHLKVVFRLDSNDEDVKVTAGRVQGDIEILPVCAQKLAENHVRVRMLRVSICQTDRRVLAGTKQSVLTHGLVLGHEGLGIVESVGSALNNSLIGATVVVLPHRFVDGDELACLGVGYLSKKMQHIGIHVDGVFCSYCDLPIDGIHILQSYHDDKNQTHDVDKSASEMRIKMKKSDENSSDAEKAYIE